MHELGLAEDVLRLVKEEAKKKGLSKLTYGKVAIGETLITHQEEFMELFSMISATSPAEGMKLEIEITPLKALCSDCKKNSTPKSSVSTALPADRPTSRSLPAARSS